ncbi:hypothetical protein UUU_22100 [Klebsiella pneumoniae subsp. pneumoniae DSM 30104 = JCM 1662 = NBRC 14940]|nr:hypothetical protein UUU_22100 [Klebsiella pneumoniae subsp. pneumoniae DSM 30104 = JCM 1662 = NBRC 14940]
MQTLRELRLSFCVSVLWPLVCVGTGAYNQLSFPTREHHNIL